MIYHRGYYSKERKQAYEQRQQSGRRMIQIEVFIGMLAFAGHFMLRTMTRSIFAETFPELMMDSNFSVLSLYNHITLLFFAIYYGLFYEYLTFAEVPQNKWYAPVKMGYSPFGMILGKLAARIVEVVSMYSIGFLVTLFMSSFLKYPLVVGNLISLYFVGIVDILLITVITMTASLFMQQQKTARYVIAATTLCIYVLRFITGYWGAVTDRNTMANVISLFSGKPLVYLQYFALIFVCSILLCIFRARYLASYSNFSYYQGDMDYEKNITLVLKSDNKFTGDIRSKYQAGRHNGFVDALVSLALVLVFVAFIALNALVLMVSLSSTDSDFNVMGVIPYVFQSDTMEPTIAYNDLAYFEHVQNFYDIAVDDIVLYKTGGVTSVARVQSREGNALHVDIDNYPQGYQQGYHSEQVDALSVYGIYQSSNRWLGALILFANSFFGRLLMMVVPCMILFFYKNITQFFSTKQK